MSTSEKRAMRVNAAGTLAVHVGGRMDPPQPPPLPREREREREEDFPRDESGWRAGKPVEDPEKMKKWGLITARPSEFLIHMRRGRVRDVSGQGASCFKLPGDSVAIVPTSVQRLRFTADQVTSEKVGVQVTGLAVYRIVDPLVAFRMLNFSFPERAQEKLRELLTEMFVGAVRRLVANLSVEECLTRRKEGLATELMREIAPVVSGRGRPEDRTDTGWGVVLDTIEIQDVRVLSDTVFANMQARYRQEQERQIALTRLVSEEEVRHKRQETEEQAKLESLAVESRVEEARVAKEHATQHAQVTLERELALARMNAELEVREREARAADARELARLDSERRMAEARLENARLLAQAQAQAELERVKLEAEAEAARHAAALARVRQEEERVRTEAKAAEARCAIAEAELARAELEARQTRITQEPELARARALKEIENTLSPESIQMVLAQQLPKVAAAFQQNMGEVHVTAVDGANPFGYIAAAVEGVMGLARSAGLQVPGKNNA